MLRALQLERHSKCTYPWHHHEQQLICGGSETLTGNLIQQSVKGWENLVACIKVSIAVLCLDSYMLVVQHQCYHNWKMVVQFFVQVEDQHPK